MLRKSGATARARVRTPGQSAGAIAIIEVSGDDPLVLEQVLAQLGVASVPVGAMPLRSIAGVDDGIVARLDQCTAWLMPHGGVAVVREILAALARADVDVTSAAAHRLPAPTSVEEVEACMLEVLARAASPAAIDLLLEQPILWRATVKLYPDALQRPATDRDRALMHLVDPALVVMVGASNIGKSTPTNTLAGRSVSIVADEPGTTRDHVGVLIDMGGVVVRWVDTPGVRTGATPEETLARESALRLARGADLLVLAGDPSTDPVAWEGNQPLLRACLRVDRTDGDAARQAGSPSPAWDVRLSCVTGEGIEALVAQIRERLVGSMASEGKAWRFWVD